MPEYRCLRESVFFKNHMFKRKDVYIGEPPVCGKGTDLTKGKKPTFALTSEPEPKEAPKPKDKDPRTDKQIREEIWEKYGERVHPNMKRKNLLVKEKLLRNLNAKDAGVAKTEYEVV